VPPDPEIDDDPDDFEREAHERDVLKSLLLGDLGLVIDGTWRDLPEDTVVQSQQDLLVESRRLPDLVIQLSCTEKSTFDRMIDKEGVQAVYEKQVADREEEKRKAREEDRAKKMEELKENEEEKTPEEIEEEMKQWEEDRDAEDEAADENDPDAPNLERLMEEEQTKLREAREADEARLEEFKTAMEGKTEVFLLQADISANYVFVKILDILKPYFQYRKDLIERQLMQPLGRKEVPFYEQSSVFKHSKFGTRSPLDPSNPLVVGDKGERKAHAVLYRERLYFPVNEEERTHFMKEPSKYTSKEAVPQDLNYNPRCVVIGLPKSGKSTLCQIISSKTGAVHLKVNRLIEEFMKLDCQESEQLRKTLKEEGRQIDDDLLISLLVKRLNFADVTLNGFVIEDFPRTRTQAMLLARKGVNPGNVFYVHTPVEKSYKRT